MNITHQMRKKSVLNIDDYLMHLQSFIRKFMVMKRRNSVTQRTAWHDTNEEGKYKLMPTSCIYRKIHGLHTEN